MDDATKHLVLFQLEACPFCVKVRRQIRRQNLKIGLRDIGKDPTAARELVEGGKLDQVPALRIPKASAATGYEWLYESDAINAYLREMFPN